MRGYRQLRTRALVVGLALAGTLWFGLIAAVVHLHSQFPHVAKVAPRVIDLGMLALNAALVVAFVSVHPFRRSGRVDADEASG